MPHEFLKSMDERIKSQNACCNSRCTPDIWPIDIFQDTITTKDTTRNVNMMAKKYTNISHIDRERKSAIIDILYATK